jgi:acyl-CoA synthetase (NDP forming)
MIGFVSPDAPALVRTLNLAGVPTFAAPESCAIALAAMLRASESAGISPPSQPAVTVSEAARALLQPGPLNEAESKRLFAEFGIPAVREIIAKSPTEAAAAAKSFTGNVVVKVLSRAVLHKSEIGGVAIDVAAADVARTCEAMAARFVQAVRSQPEGFLVQEFVSGGVELILGFHHDAQLGPAILLGMGGVTAEIYRDTAFRLAPLTRADAEAMIAELKSAPLLAGFRGRPKADVAALARTIVAFSQMVMAVGGRLADAEINPLFVLPEGVLAGDGVVVVKSG